MARAAHRSMGRSDSALLCRRAHTARETMRHQYVRVKKERGCLSTDGCEELIDLADSSDERAAGRYDVCHVQVADGKLVELIEFLSDPESCADDEAELSEPETIDLCGAPEDNTLAGKVARLGSPVHVDEPPVRVDLTRANTGGLLCEYEQIYVDLAETASSDDYGFTDSSDQAEADSDDEGSDTDTPRALSQRHPVLQPTPSLDKKAIQRKVYDEITALEMRKPWRFVYRCLEIPFESSPRTDSCGFMFEMWDDFWHQHGHAVWERMFWKPMEMDSYEYKARTNRQSRAMKAFRRLANDLHEKFGLKLIEVVKAKPHSGWWYRSKRPVDLVRMRRQDARIYALHLSRYRERWPFGVRYVRLHCNSCWCLPEVLVSDDDNQDGPAASDETEDDDDAM